jgi:opacity protein-like surface antigen
MRPSTAITVSSIALVAGLAGAVPAAAGSFGVEAQGGYHSLSASQSAKAVFDGSTGGATFGGALRYVLYKGFYIGAGARTFSKSGERVYVAAPGGPVAKLGFPLDVRITPIFGTLGYRFREGRSLVPYLGVGAGVTKFRETSDVAGDVREESRSKSSFQALAGFEYGSGMIRFGAEGVYSSASDSIGVGGVSKVYGEKDIGGFSILGKLILSFGK